MEAKDHAHAATGNPLHSRATQPGKRNRLQKVAAILALASLLPLLPMAQSYSQIDVNEYGYNVVIPNVILDANETVDIQLEIGKQHGDVEQAVGFELTVELGANAALPTSLNPNMEGSWMNQEGVGILESHGSGGSNVYTYTYDRDSPTNGSGRTLALTLKAAVDNTPAASLLSTSGGVLIVDNLDIRQAAPKTDSEVQVYPNPTTGVFTVRCGETPAQQVQILSVTGQVLRTFSANQLLDISDLSAGLYYVQICNQLNSTSRHFPIQKF
jgi:hypothetical protein